MTDPQPDVHALAAEVDDLYNHIDQVKTGDKAATETVETAIDLLDRGVVRVAEIDGEGAVVVHEWLKKAILLLFRLRAIETVEVGPFEYADRLPLKHGLAEAGVRVVPGASARRGS